MPGVCYHKINAPKRFAFKLPASFILFFVLTFFLIGEQLPALPLYIVGPGGPGGHDKVHILDLAPSDALHRPFFYLLAGIGNWILFRKFSWPIVWIVGTIVGDEEFVSYLKTRGWEWRGDWTDRKDYMHFEKP